VVGDGTFTYQWDAEGHLAAVDQSGNVVSINTYNALGQRVEDATPASTTDEAYGAGGDLLLRYTGDSNSRSFVPFGGGLLAEYFCGGMIFDHPDELGSLTASTDCTGNTVNEKLFYPFGESWTGAAMPNLGAHQTFGKLPDYDPETDEYNTANRHYSPSGRWMSPDPGGVKVVHLDDPQTWNMYAYVRDNPTTFVDPTGLVCAQVGGNAACNAPAPNSFNIQFGNDIFDAINGEPGTYLSYDRNGRMGFGFSVNLWQATHAAVDWMSSNLPKDLVYNGTVIGTESVQFGTVSGIETTVRDFGTYTETTGVMQEFYTAVAEWNAFAARNEEGIVDMFNGMKFFGVEAAGNTPLFGQYLGAMHNFGNALYDLASIIVPQGRILLGPAPPPPPLPPEPGLVMPPYPFPVSPPGAP
jgi:RHS repeat-associated protein